MPVRLLLCLQLFLGSFLTTSFLLWQSCANLTVRARCMLRGRGGATWTLLEPHLMWFCLAGATASHPDTWFGLKGQERQ